MRPRTSLDTRPRTLLDSRPGTSPDSDHDIIQTKHSVQKAHTHGSTHPMWHFVNPGVSSHLEPRQP
ncbi:UNVERIFIED_CONTAM: hypothetical protein Sradi_0685400 [Sesamum radiatum]|uniref:Uncharacterized protein n=1 Tax=Sesamum radiatum TaxID=300843 RepID=A0AAW2VLY2_SESRA